FVVPSEVIWCTTTSGAASWTAASTASRSRPSITTGTAPAAARFADLPADRVLAVTWGPAAIRARVRDRPIAAVPPATNTRMSSSCLMCKPFSTSDTAPAHRVTPRPLLHLTREECGRVQGGAHTGGMPVRLHHIVIDAHDLPALARFWTQALGW